MRPVRRKIHDLRQWTGQIECSEHQQPVEGFLMIDFVAHRVRENRVIDVQDEPHTLFADGWRWVRAHPLHAPLGTVGDALTVGFNAADEPISLYIDLHRGAGIGSPETNGRAWIDDLYLDVGALINSAWQPLCIHLLDADELAEGVERGLVTPVVARSAHARAAQIQRDLEAGSYAPLHAVRRYLQNTPCPR